MCALRCCLPLVDGDSVHLVEINPKLFPVCLPNSPSTGSTALPSPRAIAMQLCGHRRKQRGHSITRTRQKHIQTAAGGTQRPDEAVRGSCFLQPQPLDPGPVCHREQPNASPYLRAASYSLLQPRLEPTSPVPTRVPPGCLCPCRTEVQAEAGRTAPRRVWPLL